MVRPVPARALIRAYVSPPLCREAIIVRMGATFEQVARRGPEAIAATQERELAVRELSEEVSGQRRAARGTASAARASFRRAGSRRARGRTDSARAWSAAGEQRESARCSTVDALLRAPHSNSAPCSHGLRALACSCRAWARGLTAHKRAIRSTPGFAAKHGARRWPSPAELALTRGWWISRIQPCPSSNHSCARRGCDDRLSGTRSSQRAHVPRARSGALLLLAAHAGAALAQLTYRTETNAELHSRLPTRG